MYVSVLLLYKCLPQLVLLSLGIYIHVCIYLRLFFFTSSCVYAHVIYSFFFFSDTDIPRSEYTQIYNHVLRAVFIQSKANSHEKLIKHVSGNTEWLATKQIHICSNETGKKRFKFIS